MTRPSAARRNSAGAVLRGLLGSAAVAAALLLAGAAHAAPAAASGAHLPTAAPTTTKLDPNIDPHGPYTVTTDRCAMCHRAHTGSDLSMITEPTQSQLCLTCHNGTGAAADVAAEYATAPQNDPSTRSYYRHDAPAATAEVGHTLSTQDEFTGVENRHSVCTDCHNPHAARSTASTQVTLSSPWKPSGALAAVSGLRVINGEAGVLPTYAFLDGKTPATSMTADYQLCMKCHSGNTTLLSNQGWTPSRYMLDKAVEFNPGNRSFHPVEAPGTNQSPAMQASLTDIYGTMRRWTLDTQSTIRCTNCHTGGPAVASDVSVGGSLPVHVSANRGLLLANYQDRDLEPTGKAFAATDFALCFTCHSERAYSTNDTTTTNFPKHRFHVAGIANWMGNNPAAGLSIDVAGDGKGNATCSECHFRLHSTAFAVNNQPPGSRLVNFAPDVQPYNGVLSFTLLPSDPDGTSHGSCTLVCHGSIHDGKGY